MKTQETEVVDVPIKSISLKEDTQIRAETSWLTVQEYADADREGVELPPVVLYHRQGSPYYIADGWHRVLARKRNGATTVRAEVRDGTRRDALLYGCGANASHGLRRTNKDKQRAIVVMLSDYEWHKWNNSEIARRCNVSANLVKAVREKLGLNAEQTHRLQFNGRGELQYRKASNERREQQEQQTKTVKCPHCGKTIVVEL